MAIEAPVQPINLVPGPAPVVPNVGIQVENQPQEKQQKSNENPNNMVVAYENEDLLGPDFDLQGILQTIEMENVQTQNDNNSSTTTTLKKTIRNSLQVPMFNNCKICNININIRKN